MDPRWTSSWVVNEVHDKGTLHIHDLYGQTHPDLIHVNQTCSTVAHDDSSPQSWFLPKATQQTWAGEDKVRTVKADKAVERRLPTIKIIGHFVDPNP